MKNIDSAKGDLGAFWRILDRTMGAENIRAIYKHNVNGFADYFKNKIAKIRLETSDATQPTFHLETPAVMQQFKSVTVLEVVELIGMSPCKHTDLDPVPTWLLKKVSHILGPFLAALFNLSF